MRRYKCTIAYDGTDFFGYQVQLNERTVQGEIESVLMKMHKGDFIRVTASGRTDTGVHAKGQVIHFDSPLKITVERWKTALNTLLPADVSVLDVQVVTDDFHSRFDAVKKEYRYFVQLNSNKDPFTRNYSYNCPFELNTDAMEEASAFLVGTHDFTSFCSARTDVVDKVRTIEAIEFNLKENTLEIRFVGTGFLYNMVRIIVGTLIEVGIGKRSAGSIENLLLERDRRKAGKTAPAQGLYLWEVMYK